MLILQRYVRAVQDLRALAGCVPQDVYERQVRPALQELEELKLAVAVAECGTPVAMGTSMELLGPYPDQDAVADQPAGNVARWGE
jgi:hypothetical protein